MKLTNTLTRIDYVVIDFFWWVFVSKVKLLRLRQTSVISSYITSLSVAEYFNDVESVDRPNTTPAGFVVFIGIG